MAWMRMIQEHEAQGNGLVIGFDHSSREGLSNCFSVI